MIGDIRVNLEQVDINIFLILYLLGFFRAILLRMGGRWGEGTIFACYNILFLFRWCDCMIVVYFL